MDNWDKAASILCIPAGLEGAAVAVVDIAVAVEVVVVAAVVVIACAAP